MRNTLRRSSGRMLRIESRRESMGISKVYHARIWDDTMQMMIITALILSIFLSIFSFAWAFFQAGFENTAKGILIFGSLWFISFWRKWHWFPSLAMFVALFLALFGVWNDLPLVWMFSGAIFTLITWDLKQFQIKLSLLPDREDKQGMTKRRLIRIGILVSIGLMIGWGISNLFSS